MAALLVGVLVTVAVSWTLAMRPVFTLTLVRRDEAWALAPPPGWPDRPLAGYDAVGSGALQQRRWIEAVDGDPLEPKEFHQLVWATGWPWPALCSEHRSAPGDDQRWLDYATRGQPPIEGWHDAYIIDPAALTRGAKAIPGLPLRPLWPGFGMCVLVYAAAAWLLFVVPPVLRLHRRRRRGACLRCGHLLVQGSERCPECGTGRDRER